MDLVVMLVLLLSTLRSRILGNRVQSIKTLLCTVYSVTYRTQNVEN